MYEVRTKVEVRVFKLHKSKIIMAPPTTTPTYSIGDTVHVTGGTYSGRSATYLGKYGRVMCTVKIEGDTRSQRNIWLTSIKPAKTMHAGAPGGGNPHRDDAGLDDDVIRRAGRWNADTYGERQGEHMVKVPKRQLDELLEEVTSMKDKIGELEKKLKAMLIQRPN